MGKARFSDDFKRDAVAQVVDRGYPVAELSKRLGVSTHSLYAWLKTPLSKRTVEDQRQTKLIKDAWEDSGKIYGYPRPDR